MIQPMLAVSDTVWLALIAGVFALAQTWMNRRISNKLDVIHDLSNSAMGSQKRLLAASLRTHAHFTGLKVDMDAASAAENELAEHDARQAAADLTKSKQ